MFELLSYLLNFLYLSSMFNSAACASGVLKYSKSSAEGSFSILAKASGDKIPEDDKSAIETGIKELKEALEGEDFEIIKAKSDALSEVSMKLGEAMYKAAQSENLADGMPGGDMGSGINPEEVSSENRDNVVDADFEEVDPDADAKGKKDD